MKGKKIQAFALTFVFCFVFWMLLTLSFATKELILGVLVCGVSAWFTSDFFARTVEYNMKMINPIRWVKLVIYFIFIFGPEVVKSNLAMAANVLFNKPLKQAIVKVRVEGMRDKYPLALLANCITLTPGTITMEVADSDDGGDVYMYIQWMILETEDNEKAGEIIKGRMEKWIRGIWA